MGDWLAKAASLTIAVLMCACTGVSSFSTTDRSAVQRGGSAGQTRPTINAGPPAALGQVRSAPRDEGAVKVALLLPMSGSQAPVGRDLTDAAQIALFDIAANNFQMLPYDTNGTPQGAARAAQQALAEGATMILGPLLSRSVSAVAPIARSRGVPVVAFSNDLTVAGNGVYTMGFVPQDQVRRVVDYARLQGIVRFASLVPNNDYGVAMMQALEYAVPRYGAEITDVRFYTFGDPAGAAPIRGMPVAGAEQAARELADYDQRVAALERLRTQLKARDTAQAQAELKRLEIYQTIGEPDFEAILLPAGGDDVLRLAPLLAFYDVDPAVVRYLGTWLWDDPTIGAEPTMVGAWFAAPPPQARVDFIAAFERTYGRMPDRRATLAYDAVAMAAILAGRPGDRNPFSQRAMTVPNGFAGTDGIFRLLPSGIVERGLAVLEVQREGLTVRDPAPRSFGDPLVR